MEVDLLHASLSKHIHRSLGVPDSAWLSGFLSVLHPARSHWLITLCPTPLESEHGYQPPPSPPPLAPPPQVSPSLVHPHQCTPLTLFPKTMPYFTLHTCLQGLSNPCSHSPSIPIPPLYSLHIIKML